MTLIFALAAFFSCFAITLFFQITVRNPLTVVFFMLIYAGLVKLDKRGGFALMKKSAMIFGVGISFVIAFVTDMLLRQELTAGFDSGLFRLLTLIIMFIGVACLFYIGFSFIYFHFYIKGKEYKSDTDYCEKERCSANSGIRGVKLFIISVAVCLVCYLPYFLYEFPGIMTADSLVQYEQIVGARPWSNHHPVVHTLLIKLFYSIGLWMTHDANTAISFYTVFQMLFVSLCCSRAVLVVDELAGYRYKFAKWLALAFFAVMPFNAVFAVTLWKDVPFSCITLLLLCHLIGMTKKEGSIPVIDWFIFAILSMAFCLFRSNAWFAFLVWSVIALICFRKDFLKALLSVVCVVMVVVMIKGPVFKFFAVESPDFTESLSVPLQQVAAVLVNDRVVPAEDMELIEDVIDTTYIHELYAPNFADNIKELVRAGHPEVLENNKAVYLRLWLRLLKRYPADFVKAWFDLVGGYIYPDVPYKVGDVDGIMGNELGLYWRPLIGGKIVVKTKEILIKLSDFVPLYGMLWSIGAYSWLLLICFVAGIFRKHNVLGMVLLIFLTGTLLIASPVVDFRYAYGVILSCPVWVSGIYTKDKNTT